MPDGDRRRGGVAHGMALSHSAMALYHVPWPCALQLYTHSACRVLSRDSRVV